MIEDHQHWTGSKLAERILRNFNQFLPRFVRVMPTDYKAVLDAQAAKIIAEKIAKHHVSDVSFPSTDSPAASHKAASEPALVDLEDSMVDEEAIKKRAPVLDKIRGFMKYDRINEPYRNPRKRVKDWAELSTRITEEECKVQAARCMDCGVPFCQSDSGCPIGNIIPKWNDLVFKGQWQDALNRLLMTNNFPEVSLRLLALYPSA
jgi:glutamate synthase (NADPH/NADH)